MFFEALGARSDWAQRTRKMYGKAYSQLAIGPAGRTTRTSSGPSERVVNRATGAFILGALVLAACSPAVDPPMTRSCRGEYVDECRPYTYARIVGATLTPSGITLNDPVMRAQVHVDFTRCDMGTMPLTVEIAAFVGGDSVDAHITSPSDGGGSSNARVIPLTTIGPVTPGTTSIDVTIDNPFFANVPANSPITLQFAPIIDGCQGDLFTIAYQTGPVLGTH